MKQLGPQFAPLLSRLKTLFLADSRKQRHLIYFEESQSIDDAVSNAVQRFENEIQNFVLSLQENGQESTPVQL